MQSPEHDAILLEWFVQHHTESERARLIVLWGTRDEELNHGRALKYKLSGGGGPKPSDGGLKTVAAVAGANTTGVGINTSDYSSYPPPKPFPRR